MNDPLPGGLLAVRHADPDVRRRGRLLLVADLALLGFFGLVAPLILVLQGQVAAVLIIAGVMALLLASFALTRRGLVGAGAALLLALLLAGPPAVMLGRGSLAATPFFFAFAVLAAGLALRPWQIWPVAALALALLGMVAARVPPNGFDGALRPNLLGGAALLVIVTALFAFLGARVNRTALQLEAGARAEADRARAALQGANADLERQVAERTGELRRTLDELGARAAAQERLLGELAAQREVIHEMSVPVLPVTAATLVMPLVGALDGARLEELRAQALGSVERARARRLVIDITGVPVVDTHVARGLMETVRAVRLLGAEAMLVGIRPEVAQTVVSLGVELMGLRTAATLEDALRR